ncbi:cell shape-determining protein [Clostridium sardiniense]|uniref:cell shape-determining protein n=1 Tax=Clostridium sardiniense TaxID=29369 RepID=UPI003D33A899
MAKDKKASFKGYLKWLVISYLVMAIILFLQSRLILDLSISFLALIIPFIISSIAYGVTHFSKKYIIAGGTGILIYVALMIVFSPLVSYKAHRDLIGEVDGVEFSSQIQHIDLKQLPTIDKELASKLADKKLGEIPSLGSQVYIGDLTLQSVNGELYYVAPLEHSSLIKWITNYEGTPGYVKVSATNQNDVELVTEVSGKPLKIKYLESSYLLTDLDRAAFFRDMKAAHTDYTFELDDEGNPYWVITRYDTGVGITEAKATGALIIDAQTGEAEVYEIENMPKWVDRIQPDSFIKRYIDKWGKLVHGVFNFSDKDKLVSTEGMNLIYNNDECYYYTGITSVGNDEGLVGFTLTNTRTGKTTMYKTSGATETAAMKSAEGKVQQYKYTATFPYLINIQNEPTYFMTLKDANGLVKNYAMVNVKNYNTVAVGDSLQSTLNKYLEVLTNTNISLEGSNNAKSVEGEIERIGLVVKEGSSIYDVKLKGSDNIYSVSTETAREVALSKVGDKVKIDYMNVGDSRYIIVNSFSNVNTEVKNKEKGKKDNTEAEKKEEIKE